MTHNEENRFTYNANIRNVYNSMFYDHNTNTDPILRSITPYYSMNYQDKQKIYDKMCQNLTECDYGGVNKLKHCFERTQSMKCDFVFIQLLKHLFDKYLRDYPKCVCDCCLEINLVDHTMHQNLTKCDYSYFNIVKHCFAKTQSVKCVLVVKLMKQLLVVLRNVQSVIMHVGWK